MAATREFILSEIERLQKARIKMEYKERRLWESYKDGPPPETVLTYRMIMEGIAAEYEALQKELDRFYPVPV